MSKAVLVMDMPKCCRDCPCSDLPLDESIPDTCLACNEILHNPEVKPAWCPLKEVEEVEETVANCEIERIMIWTKK